MKKCYTLFVILVLVFSNALMVQASTEPKVTESYVVTTVDQAKVGETISLKAETQKRGAEYREEWDGATLSQSYLDEATGNYISEANFTPTQAGTYTITYTITMYTGNNEEKFIGRGTKTLEVLADAKEVIGLEVRNVVAYPNIAADGTLKGYSVLGELFVLWNDQTTSSYGTVGYYFLPNETLRVVNITVNIDNQQYTFPVTISINP